MLVARQLYHRKHRYVVAPWTLVLKPHVTQHWLMSQLSTLPFGHCMHKATTHTTMATIMSSGWTGAQSLRACSLKLCIIPTHYCLHNQINASSRAKFQYTLTTLDMHSWLMNSPPPGRSLLVCAKPNSSSKIPVCQEHDVLANMTGKPDHGIKSCTAGDAVVPGSLYHRCTAVYNTPPFMCGFCGA